MMKTITTVLGAVLCLTAVVGFFNHGFMRMDLNPLHDVILLVIGAASLYFGMMGTEFQARYTCRTLGVLFAALGLITLFSGHGVTTNGVTLSANHVFKVLPGQLEYTSADGVRDLIIGLAGLIAGFFPREKEIEIDMKAKAAQQKVASKI